MFEVVIEWGDGKTAVFNAISQPRMEGGFLQFQMANGPWYYADIGKIRGFTINEIKPPEEPKKDNKKPKKKEEQVSVEETKEEVKNE
jgi:hypothetical protein